MFYLKEEGLALIFYWQTKNTRLKIQKQLKLALVIIIC